MLGFGMARYKHIDTSPRLLPVNLELLLVMRLADAHTRVMRLLATKRGRLRVWFLVVIRRH